MVSLHVTLISLIDKVEFSPAGLEGKKESHAGCPAGLEETWLGPAGLEHPAGARIRKKALPLFSKNSK